MSGFSAGRWPQQTPGLQPWYTAPAPEARSTPEPQPSRSSDSETFTDEAGFLRVTQELIVDLADVLSADATEAEVLNATKQLIRERFDARGIAVSLQRQQTLAEAVLAEMFGLGPLQRFVDDEQVENIDINGCDDVWISYRDGRRERGPIVAASDDDLVEKIRRWTRHGTNAREFSTANPLLNAALVDIHGIRLAAVMSVSPRPCVSIRRHRLVDVTLGDLEAGGTLDAGLHAFLKAAVRARMSIIVTGATNAGKTTLLRALIGEIDPSERIATLETDYELMLHRLPHKHHDVIAFEARQANSEGEGAVSLHELIPQALRMSPSRIIVGEVRSTEIVQMLEAMGSGHEGSMCTLHANAAEQVFGRILILALRGGLDMPPHVIHLLVGMSVDLVVHVSRDPATGRRVITEVLEVSEPGDNERPTVNRVYRPGPDGRAQPAATPHHLDDLVRAGFDPGWLQAGAS